MACHRVTVARHLLEAAQARGLALDVAEWPGGEPRLLDLHVPPAAVRKLLTGGRSVPLGQNFRDAELGSLPWASIARIHSTVGTVNVAVGPPRFGPKGWYLPVPGRRRTEGLGLLIYRPERSTGATNSDSKCGQLLNRAHTSGLSAYRAAATLVGNVRTRPRRHFQLRRVDSWEDVAEGGYNIRRSIFFFVRS